MAEKTLIFGGTFNPVHYGHLRLSVEAAAELGLKKVVFVPVCSPPHKDDPELLIAEERFKMLELAIKGNRDFSVSDTEIRRGGKSYSIDTVREFVKDGIDPVLLIGADQFNAITTWCEYEELLKLTDLAVAPRPGLITKKPGEALPVELARKFWYDTERKLYGSSFGRTIKYLETTLLDISSTAIRGLIKEGRSIRYLMPREVEEYISTNGFYK